MIHDIQVPSSGESVTEVFIGKWRKNNGDLVKKGEILVDLETQKANFELESEYAGRLEIITPNTGDKALVGAIIARVDDSAKTAAASSGVSAVAATSQAAEPDAPISPEVRKLLIENNLDAKNVKGSGKNGRILKEDIQTALAQKNKPASTPAAPIAAAPVAARPAAQLPAYTYTFDPSRGDRREPATRIRRVIAENLVKAQHTAAILTTFNEIDMTAILAYREKNKETFKKEHGTSLGMVGFFALAAARAVKLFPLANATFTGDDVIYHDALDLSIAVSTDRGLVVPVLRDVQKMDLVAFEKGLSALSVKARDGKLGIPDMSGGTFTISNGGVFGSLLSTPLLNMPQTAILGLHKTQKRAVVIDDKIEIRPMMYAALSYDHRLIDGKEAVQFLVAIKEGVENLSLIGLA